MPKLTLPNVSKMVLNFPQETQHIPESFPYFEAKCRRFPRIPLSDDNWTTQASVRTPYRYRFTAAISQSQSETDKYSEIGDHHNLPGRSQRAMGDNSNLSPISPWTRRSPEVAATDSSTTFESFVDSLPRVGSRSKGCTRLESPSCLPLPSICSGSIMKSNESPYDSDNQSVNETSDEQAVDCSVSQISELPSLTTPEKTTPTVLEPDYSSDSSSDDCTESSSTELRSSEFDNNARVGFAFCPKQLALFTHAIIDSDSYSLYERTSDIHARIKIPPQKSSSHMKRKKSRHSKRRFKLKAFK